MPSFFLQVSQRVMDLLFYSPILLVPSLSSNFQHRLHKLIKEATHGTTTTLRSLNLVINGDAEMPLLFIIIVIGT
jgi:hypothetical protein